MSDYIINPMWFYWLNVIDTLKSALVSVGSTFAFISVALFIIFIANAWVEDELKTVVPFVKKFIPVVIISVSLCTISIFIPSKTTMIEMELARHVTYTNAENAKEDIREIVDYIIEKAKETKGETK